MLEDLAFVADNYTLKLLLKRLQAHGVRCEHIPDSDIIQISYNNHIEYLANQEFPNISLGDRNIINDKFYFKKVLQRHGFPVLDGDVFHSSLDYQLIMDYVAEKVKFPITIKPTDAACGNQVFCAIQDYETLKDIWSSTIQKFPPAYYLIEPCWNFCPDNRCIIFSNGQYAICKRSVPTIVGDGVRSIEQLVAQENFRRENPRDNCLCDIVLSDEDGMRCLKDQNLSLSDIPRIGEMVKLRYISNLSYGGMAEIIPPEIVHPSYAKLFSDLWALFPSLPFLTVDILAEDLSLPATVENMVINESHVTPGIGMFIAPGKGVAVDVCTPMILTLFPELA